MRVVIGEAGASLEHADEFTSFDFVSGLPEAELGRIVSRLGLGVASPDGEYVWFAPASLAQLAGELADDAWMGRLHDMAAYASTRAWVDDSGRVRAHRSRRTSS
jgi:hypothetical protein